MESGIVLGFCLGMLIGIIGTIVFIDRMEEQEIKKSAHRYRVDIAQNKKP